MAKEPNNPQTWADLAEQVAVIREAVDDLDAPPQPDDAVGQGMYTLKQGLESLEHSVGRRVTQEADVEEDEDE